MKFCDFFANLDFVDCWSRRLEVDEDVRLRQSAARLVARKKSQQVPHGRKISGWVRSELSMDLLVAEAASVARNGRVLGSNPGKGST